MLRSHRLAAVCLICGAALASSTSAQPNTADAPGKSGDAPAQDRDRSQRAEMRAAGADRMDKAGGKDRDDNDRGDKDRRGDGKDGRGLGRGHDMHHGGPGMRHGAFRSRLRELGEQYKTGKLKKEELQKELAKLAEDRNERRQRRREMLKQHWGEGLAQAAVREELRHHERRMAQLSRMAFVAQTERTGADRDKLVERIEKLTDKERERHQRKMTQLGARPMGGPPPADASAAQGARGAPAASAAAPAAAAKTGGAQ